MEPRALRMGAQNVAATVENSMAVPQTMTDRLTT